MVEDNRFNLNHEDNELSDYYYDNPCLPGQETLLGMRRLMLNRDDAETVLINTINQGRRLSSVERRALQEVMEWDSEREIDFLSVLRRIRNEEEVDNDY